MAPGLSLDPIEIGGHARDHAAETGEVARGDALLPPLS